MMRSYKPPENAPGRVVGEERAQMFLAGSIDMGAASDWQQTVTDAVADLPVDVYNPRRENWDLTWVQDISNPMFRIQVEWELDHLDRADVIACYFDAAGKAPITLMELGLHAASGKVVVYCPKAYWRSGNVQVICARLGVPLFENEVEPFLDAIRKMILTTSGSEA